MVSFPKSGRIYDVSCFSCSHKELKERCSSVKFQPYKCMVWLTYQSTLVCDEHGCVFQFSSSNSVKARVTRNGQTFVYCTRAISFVCCTQAILCMLPDSKKHASNTLCTAHELLPYSTKFWRRKTLADLVNGMPFANILPAKFQIH